MCHLQLSRGSDGAVRGWAPSFNQKPKTLKLQGRKPKFYITTDIYFPLVFHFLSFLFSVTLLASAAFPKNLTACWVQTPSVPFLLLFRTQQHAENPHVAAQFRETAKRFCANSTNFSDRVYNSVYKETLTPERFPRSLPSYIYFFVLFPFQAKRLFAKLSA